MIKTFTKALFLAAIFVFFASGYVFAQNITIGPVDPGPYAPGSSITAPINVTGPCVNTTTTYNLFLSNAAGSFAAPTLIGTFGNFYTTFINGVIPAGTPAGVGYKLEVVSVNPAITSTISNAFTIAGGAAVTAAITSLVINPTYPEVFGACNGINNMVYNFINQSTAGAAVTATFFNELSQVTEGTIVPTAAGSPFTAKAAQYTISVKATSGGIVGTKSYFLINNVVNTSFGVTGSSTICLSGGGSLTYNVDISSPSGIQNNFPGLIYTISWGDGSNSLLTLCDIIAGGGKISHIYSTSSCGNNPNGVNNAFEVDLQPSSLYCGKIGTQVSSYAQVITAPKNSFSTPVAACNNVPVTFINTSDPGQDPNATTASCKSLNALYTWIVDGVAQVSNYSLNQNFIYTFTSTGTHTVTLHLQNPSPLCPPVDISQTICIQNPPQPLFTLPVATGCVPVTITPVNQSVIDANCNAANQYVWTVTGPVPVTYAGGTNANSVQPQFVFSTAGTYQVQLGITTASCGTILSPTQTVIVNSVATAQLSPDITLCGINQTLTFDPTPGATQTILSGSAQNNPGTYTWTVTGGNYTFTGGTTATSQYPQINFTSLATYTITVVNTNVCGAPATATQLITFVQAPTVTAGIYPPFCGNQQLMLVGTIHGGNVISTQWVGGTGTFTPSRAALTAAYTPSAAEVAAGTVTLTLQAATALPPPCNSISNSTTITITQPDSITSAPVDSVCSGVPVNYQITAALANSTFTWTVDPANTTATASGYAANGSGNVINDILVNSDPNNAATVTYDIVAVGTGGCASNKFVLTVSIAPKIPVAKFTQDITSGCGNVTVQFTNNSTPANSNYTWDFGDGTPTSSATNPTHTFIPRTDGKDTVYTITLTIQSKCGNALPFTSTVTVRPQTPLAHISPQQIAGCSPFILVVDNTSPGTNVSYTYYLYDTNNNLIQQITVTNKNPVTFQPLISPAGKQYTLYMIATGFCETTGQTNNIPITVTPPNIIAQMFSENGTTKGCVPLNVNFVNNSVGGDTYFYNVYDVNHLLVNKVPAGTAPLPYTFNAPGTYYVDVSGSNACASATSAPDIRFDVYPIPAPQFTADVTTGCKNVTITFTNNTPADFNTPSASLLYQWDFGDGSPPSFLYQPSHTYNFKNSPFTVTLTATNTATNCSNVVTQTNYINITAPPATAFTETPDSIANIPNYHFSFSDQTTDSPASWKWTFGDGQSSTSRNPGHTYADSGLFKVTLTTATKSGCDSTIVHYVRITGIPGQLFLPNAFEPDGNTVELRTFLAKGSGIKEWHMQVFNNYSQLVWETTKLDDKGSPVEGWDGTFKGVPMPQGVYVWQASATFINGSEWKGNVINNSLPKRVGVIHLIR